MKAMIFAAGLGTRLYPITKDKPKALAPFLNDTLLSYNLKNLAKQGITEFVINTHHFAHKIEEYLLENNNFGLDIKLSYEEELLDTAGGLAFAANLLGNTDDILLYNVDVVSNIDIMKMYNIHKENNNFATLAVRNRSTSRYLLFDNSDKLIGWRNINNGDEIWCNEKTENAQQFAFSGVHWVNNAILKQLEVKKQSIVPFYLEKGENNSIMAYQHDIDYWFDCGKIESLKQAEKGILK